MQLINIILQISTRQAKFIHVCSSIPYDQSDLTKETHLQSFQCATSENKIPSLQLPLNYWKRRRGRGRRRIAIGSSFILFLSLLALVNLVKEAGATIDSKLTGNSIDTTIKLAHRATLINRLVTSLPPSNFIKSIFH